jgi:predicted MFS family arabinose efflux permease
VLIELAGNQDGWRWVFLINLFISAAGLVAAIRLLPRRDKREDHGLDPAARTGDVWPSVRG